MEKIKSTPKVSNTLLEAEEKKKRQIELEINKRMSVSKVDRQEAIQQILDEATSRLKDLVKVNHLKVDTIAIAELKEKINLLKSF